MAFLLNWGAFVRIKPNGAPPKLGDQGMVSFPGLEVNSTKNSFPLSPESPDAFKQMTTVGKGRICAFQSFIILVDILSLTDQKNGVNPKNYSNLESISEGRSVNIRDRGDVL